MADLEQLGSWIPDVVVPYSRFNSVVLEFSLIATFNLTKTENRTKRSHTIDLSKVTIFAPQKRLILTNKISEISKIKGFFVLKGILFETTCVSELTYHISSF